jgi:signal transduction histidine kinase
LDNFFIYKNYILIILLFIFSVIIWYFSKFFIENIFEKIEQSNKKLKDYNHYLAHELKTPISIINSNMEVLKYWFDEKIVEKSKWELKNITKIIDSLLDYSQTIQIQNKTNINLENFLQSQNIFLSENFEIIIHNKLFNFHINTDKILFERITKNLIENAKKYSLDNKLDIFILEDKLIFENKIDITLNKQEIQKISEKFKRKSENKKNWYWLGICFIKEIVKNIGYEMKIISENNKFIVEII